MVKLKKKIVTGLFFIVMLISSMSLGCIGKDEKQNKLSEEDITQMVRLTPTVIGEEKIGGKYQAKILTVRTEYEGNVETWQQIEYIKDNKTIRDDFGFPDIIKALDWIKLNTPENAVIIGWWDYGNSIRGYTGRDVVIDFTSRELLDTITAYKYMTPEQQKKMEDKLVPHQKIKDVSKVLTTTNPQEAINIMKNYNANYLFVYKRDSQISHIFFSALEMAPLEPNSESFRNTIIGKASQGNEIDGFKLVYSDESVRLYSVI